MQYPETKKINFEYELCGQKLKDPYQWLENLEDSNVNDWVKKQNNLFLSWARKEKNYEADLTKVQNYLESEDKIPHLSLFKGYLYHFNKKRGFDYGYFRRVTVEDYKRYGKEASWEELFNLDEYNKNKGNAKWQWATYDIHERDDDKLLIQLSDAGKDASICVEYSLNKKEIVKDGFNVPLSKGATNWSESVDAAYTSYTENDDEKSESGFPLVVRRIERSSDFNSTPVYRAAKNSIMLYPQTFFDDEKNYVVIHEFLTFFKKRWAIAVSEEAISEASFKILPLNEKDDFITIYKDFLIFQKKHGENKNAICALNIPDFLNRKEVNVGKLTNGVILEHGKTFLSKEALFFIELEKAIPVLKELKLEVKENSEGKNLVGNLVSHKNPEGGIYTWISSSQFDEEIFLRAEGFLLEPSIYSMKNGNMELIQQIGSVFDRSDLAFERLDVETKDGISFPLDIVRRKNMQFNSTTPCLLYAYGGFEITIVPHYNPSLGIAWLEKGGIFALAHIRGGGDFGSTWHEAGRKEKREIVFNDFIAAAETLVKKKYTSPQKLSIKGGSNGGLLVGATMAKRPDLFRAVVSQVPLLDMLRFVFLPPGAIWVDEYGDSRKKPDFDWIKNYSPYQNIYDNKKYPNVFFQTSSTDDRVHPGHARKMAALMQEKVQDNLVFFYETKQGGHSLVGKLRDVAEEQLLSYSFLKRILWEN